MVVVSAGADDDDAFDERALGPGGSAHAAKSTMHAIVTVNRFGIGQLSGTGCRARRTPRANSRQ